MMTRIPLDEPKLFRSQQAIADRLAQLYEPHIKPLTSFVEQLREETGSTQIPFFDPWDGGINAECLFLLEAPGGKAVASNFISRNNNDETAKNFFNISIEAGLPRVSTVTWNIVPWYIGTATKIRAANSSDIAEGFKYLSQLIELLPKLKAVVLLGRKAQKTEYYFPTVNLGVRVFRSPHPSPLFVNNAPGNRKQILDIFVEVAQYLSAKSVK